jgi:nucleoid DNA-binding protein
LNPKNYKDFYPEIAEECNAHIDLVGDLVSFYYGRVRKALSELEGSKIYLPNLGTFSLRKIRLEKSIKRHKDILGNIQKNTYKGYGKHIPIKEKIETLENALSILNKEIENKKKFKDENR